MHPTDSKELGSVVAAIEPLNLSYVQYLHMHQTNSKELGSVVAAIEPLNLSYVQDTSQLHMH